MLALSVSCALAASALFLVALFELAGLWWAMLACAFMLAYVAYVASTMATAPAQPESETT